MPALVRPESADFNVVAQQKRICGRLVLRASEELLLKIEAGPPCEVGSDFQIFAPAMPCHIGSKHAHRWRRIVRTARSMNMMVATPPTERRGINPAFDLKAKLFGLGFHLHVPRFGQRFRSAME